MTADNRLSKEEAWRDQFHADLKRILRTGRAGEFDVTSEQKIRIVNVLLKAGRLSKEELVEFGPSLGGQARLSSCPVHGLELFVKIEGTNAFVCPEKGEGYVYNDTLPSAGLNRTG